MKRIKKFAENHPIITGMLAGLGLIVAHGLIKADPLAPAPLMNYQVIYDDADNINDDSRRAGFSCEGRKGYFWWAKVIKPGLIIDMEKIVGCAETQELAKRSAERYLTQQLESRKSYDKMYEAFISKEDVVTFSEKQ
jgi:hypothetical protein